jgi:hypothetical protein
VLPNVNLKKNSSEKLLLHLLQKFVSFVFNLKLKAENMHQELLSDAMPLTYAQQFNMIMYVYGMCTVFA